MSLTANTATTAAAVDTTVITKRYSGEVDASGYGTTNLTLYTCPEEKLAYIYFQSLYLRTFQSGVWHFYIGDSGIETTTYFPGTIFQYGNNGSSTIGVKRYYNDRLIVVTAPSQPPILGLALNDVTSTTSQISLGPVHATDYAGSDTWYTNASNSIQPELPSYVILNPNNQLKYSHFDASARRGVWDFIVKEHAYVAPT